MLIIINDLVQNSDAPASIKSFALADTYTAATSGNIDFSTNKTFNAVGFGNTDATTVTFTTVSGLNQAITVGSGDDSDGLYVIPSTTDDIISWSHDGTYIGRIAVGQSRDIGFADDRQVGFYSTQVPRITASGQVEPGAGGYSGRHIQLTFPYQFDSDVFGDIFTAQDDIAKGIPWFMAFSSCEQTKGIPFIRLYASPPDPSIFFNSVLTEYRYSGAFDFYQRF